MQAMCPQLLRSFLKLILEAWRENTRKGVFAPVAIFVSLLLSVRILSFRENIQLGPDEPETSEWHIVNNTIFFLLICTN